MFESKDSTLGIYNRVDVNRLGCCNAFIRKCYLRDMKGFILTKCELVSYCAPVATCSNATRKHVGRFLKERC